MKSCVVFILFSCSTAFACPDLSGAYTCQKNSYRKETVYRFQQSQAPTGTWSFSIAAQPVGEAVASSYVLIADGVLRDVVDEVSGQRLQLQASCSASSLHVEGTTKLPNGTHVRFSEDLRLLASGDLLNQSLDINGQLVNETCTSLAY